MKPTTRTQRRYDHRLRELVRTSGNIAHATRVMTTAIALETSKGDLALALGLGLVLLVLALGINALATVARELGARAEG